MGFGEVSAKVDTHSSNAILSEIADVIHRPIIDRM